jgi:hypothetical protein
MSDNEQPHYPKSKILRCPKVKITNYTSICDTSMACLLVLVTLITHAVYMSQYNDTTTAATNDDNPATVLDELLQMLA